MESLYYFQIINFITSGVVPNGLTTKSARQSFKIRASSYQLGEENQLIKQLHDNLNVDNRSTTAYHPQSIGLVESHNKIIKRKIAKFIFNKDVEWPCKLQPACLSANIHKNEQPSTVPSAYVRS